MLHLFIGTIHILGLRVACDNMYSYFSNFSSLNLRNVAVNTTKILIMTVTIFFGEITSAIFGFVKNNMGKI